MKTARERLQELAREARTKAVEAHSQGMALLERSANIAQLARMANDEQCIKILHALEQGAEVNDAVNSQGGSG